MINNLLKRLVSIKYENIVLLLYIPYMIINLLKASTDLFMVAIMMHLLLIKAVHYGIRETRQDIKQYIYQLKPIMIIDLKAIKKEIFTKAIIFIPTKAKNNIYNTFLNNSLNQL